MQSRRSRPQPRTSLYPAGSDTTLVHVASKPSALACPIARQRIPECRPRKRARLFFDEGDWTERRGDERTRTADILNASDPRQRRAHRDRLSLGGRLSGIHRGHVEWIAPEVVGGVPDTGPPCGDRGRAKARGMGSRAQNRSGSPPSNRGSMPNASRSAAISSSDGTGAGCEAASRIWRNRW